VTTKWRPTAPGGASLYTTDPVAVLPSILAATLPRPQAAHLPAEIRREPTLEVALARARGVHTRPMRRILEAGRPDPFAVALLTVAAVGVLVAGFQHARLFHRGYAEVQIVATLFLMNAVGSTVVVLTLIFRRTWVFVLGAVSICVPSLASIAISHSSGFFGFREGGYDVDALVIVVAEAAAIVFAAIGAVAAFRESPAP